MPARHLSRLSLAGGALFVGTCGLGAFFVATFSPLWWFSTTELQGQMCSCGTGLWRANVTWGDDLTEAHLDHPMACSALDPVVVERCDAATQQGRDETRLRGKIAGAFGLAAIAAGAFSSVQGWKQLARPTDGKYSKLGFVSALVSLALAVLMVGTFTWAAPIYEDLSELFACRFQFRDPLNSNALKCHAVGPGWGVAVAGILLMLSSSSLYYFSYKPTEYVDPSSGRYSLFMEEFEKRDYFTLRTFYSSKNKPLLMTDRESSPPADMRDSLQRFVHAYMVPLLLISNATLFVYSNCSTGATVEPHILITLPKSLVPLIRDLGILISDSGVVEIRDDVFNFTIVTSLRHFWSGSAYWLAFLIGIFSGLWPYVKILTMMFLWFVPASERVRGRLLHWLDVLGKWSLVDAYVLCLMTVAFAFTANQNVLGDFLNIHVQIEVRPGWGVYSFVVATMWSLTMSHWLTAKHKAAVERRQWTPEFLRHTSRPPHESLDSRPYAPFKRRRRIACSRMGRLIMYLSVCAVFVVCVCGQTLKTFAFEFSGLVELLMDPNDLKNEFSIVSNGLLIPAHAKGGGYLSGYPWNWFICVMYFAFALGVPLLRLALLGVLWVFPLTLKNTRSLYMAVQVVTAWSALDVFLVSVVAAVFEIGGLSKDVLSSAFGDIENALCEGLQALPIEIVDLILKMVGLPPLDLKRGCSLFRVDAELISGISYLIAAVLVTEVLSHVVMEFADAAISERMALLEAYVIKQGGVTRVGQASSIVDREDGGDTFTSSTSDGPGPGPTLRRLLSLQEEGASEFVGSYFDSFYGPFPPIVWKFFLKIGLMERVEWHHIAQALHVEMSTEDEPIIDSRPGGVQRLTENSSWIAESPWSS